MTFFHFLFFIFRFFFLHWEESTYLLNKDFKGTGCFYEDIAPGIHKISLYSANSCILVILKLLVNFCPNIFVGIKMFFLLNFMLFNTKFAFVILKYCCHSLFVSFLNHCCLFLWISIENELRGEIFRNHKYSIELSFEFFYCLKLSFAYLNQTANADFLSFLKDCS